MIAIIIVAVIGAVSVLVTATACSIAGREARTEERK